MTIIETLPQEQVSVNYDLTLAERVDIYQDSIKKIGEVVDLDDDGLSTSKVLMVPHNHPLSNVARSIEKDMLPDTPEWLAPYELGSRFLLVLPDEETDPEAYKTTPAHAFRINTTSYGGTSNSRLTGLPTIDDFIVEGVASPEELINYYDVPDLATLGSRYLDVPANIAVGGVRRSIRNPYSAFGYRAIFEIVRDESLRGVVAYQNEAALSSLGHLGIKHHPLCGDSSRGIRDGDALARGEEDQGMYYALTIEGIPWSMLTDGSAEHNTRMFADPEYAGRYSRLAVLVAKKKLNIIKVL